MSAAIVVTRPAQVKPARRTAARLERLAHGLADCAIALHDLARQHDQVMALLADGARVDARVAHLEDLVVLLLDAHARPCPLCHDRR